MDWDSPFFYLSMCVLSILAFGLLWKFRKVNPLTGAGKMSFQVRTYLALMLFAFVFIFHLIKFLLSFF